jgi:hypothetical protein
MVQAILPLVMVIALGALLRRVKGVPDEFWVGAEFISYRVLLPALLVVSLADADLAMVAVDRLALATVPVLLVLTPLSLLAARAIGCDAPAQTSVLQGAIRFNNFVCFGLAATLYGVEGTAVAAILAGFIVPLVNMLVVGAFAVCIGRRPSLGQVAWLIASNPLILGCVMGAALSASGIGLAPALRGTLLLLAQAAIGVGLLCIGAGLDLRAAGRAKAPLALAVALKLIVVPAGVFAGITVLGVTGVAAGVAMILAASPTAASSYVLARQLGGDAPLVAGIITVQTLAAMLTMPFWI